MWWWAAVIGYGLLAVSTVARTWRDPHVAPIGVTLLLGYLLSNAISITMSYDEQPAALTVVEVLISSVAFVCWYAGGPKVLAVVVTASLLSIVSNMAISLIPSPSKEQLDIWIGITNVCFVVECFMTIIGGIGHHAGTGHHPARSVRGGQAASAHAVVEKD